jgi:hypothetical protein
MLPRYRAALLALHIRGDVGGHPHQIRSRAFHQALLVLFLQAHPGIVQRVAGEIGIAQLAGEMQHQAGIALGKIVQQVRLHVIGHDGGAPAFLLQGDSASGLVGNSVMVKGCCIATEGGGVPICTRCSVASNAASRLLSPVESIR